MKAADNPYQLALIEPCPICLRLTASPAARQSDIDPWGVGAHRHCRTAAARWYPTEYAQGVAAVADRAAHEARVNEIAEQFEEMFGPAAALREVAP
ncbi:hypothetical protein [Mycolicibacterium mageritense]|uniref:Uncharacterized protein n=1 Tax=Mycolicibacterium mageritense TaxID=53462 RepID=A0AAI8XLF1_MYCME|nr:hypothetical protein [Mycolicibacterium mageritense]BDY26623.1 hypothetical protein hbim_00537 [Mycolicibacterium mageritense]